MRDTARIDKMIGLLAKIWKENPDMRLGQLVGNVAKFDTLTGDIRDLYLIEDELMLTQRVTVYAGGWKSLYKNENNSDAE